MGTIGIESQALTIRRATPDDAEAVAELNGQLGYPATAAEIRVRIVALASCEASQTVFVACLGQEVVGWIDVALTFHLQSQPFALIGGLVVKQGLRGRRIGKRLCEEAERWGRAKGVQAVRVTSRSTRDDAHRFYLRDGYKDVKTSRVFEKILQAERR
jgi:predicted N-acetyltransferase YhbS